MNVNLRHLFVFLEAARLEGIAAAAKSTHLSQPAVTQAIAIIERFFNAPLFLRRPNGVRPTKAGEVAAKRIERALQRLRQAIAELGGPTPATLDVGRYIRFAQIDALDAVVEHRSFSAAARARKVSQPTIFRAARDLEKSLRVSLFEKTSYGIVPTRAAERFVRRARLAMAELTQAQSDLAHLEGGSRGRTVIGAMPLARTYLVPKAVIEFARAHPEHQVSIVEGTYESLLHDLRIGEIDFLIGALRDPATLSEVSQESLFDDPLCIVVRANHPLAVKKRVSTQTLQKYEWIAPRRGSPLRAHFTELFAKAKLQEPRASIECNSLAASRALLMESDRVMLLSAHQVHYELKSRVLVTLPHPLGRITRTIGITSRDDWHPTSAQTHLLEILRSMAGRAMTINNMQ